MKSFSAQAKEELARMEPGKPCCMLSELCALLYTAGTLTLLSGGRLRLRVESKHAATVRRAFQLLRKQFDVQPSLTTVKNSRLGGSSGYRVELEGDEARRVLSACGLLGDQAYVLLKEEDLLSRSMKPCCRQAFLRGAFLGAGSVANPEKEYHLEFVATDESLGNVLIALLERQGLQARSVERKGSTVVYVKEAEQIVELLSVLGAHAARCTLEDVRILKSLRNQVNRATNCDSANIAKALDASGRQLQAIDRIERQLGLERLPEPLQEVARRRRQYPEMTLIELGKTLRPPVGKSGVNHRLKRIEEIAATLGEET